MVRHFLKQKKSVLTSQKRINRKISGIYPFLISASLVLWTYLVFEKKKEVLGLYLTSYLHKRNGLSDDLTINLLVINPEQTKNINENILKSVSISSFYSGFNSIESIGKIIFNYSVFNKVQLMHSQPRALTVVLRLRDPILCLSAGKLKFVDSGGYVYGSPETKNSCEHGILRGIPIKGSHSALNSLPPNFQLDDTSMSIVNEAVALLNRLEDSFQSVHRDLLYHDTRGFIIQLSGKGPLVFMGRSPFEQKITRLEHILQKNDGLSLEVVELDYVNKAFLKFSKEE